MPSDPFAVREALHRLFVALDTLPEDDRSTAELVLAEALNNIVEHAYARWQGEIEIVVQQIDTALVCTIVDHGDLMPGGHLPDGLPPTARLAEGGFGWHLIRALASDLKYRRIGHRNELTFRLEWGQ